MAKELYPEFRYFVTWPPPHRINPSHTPMTKETAGRVWYWDAKARQWHKYGHHSATEYGTHKEAERAAFIASVTPSEYGSPMGAVKVSRKKNVWLGRK